MARQKVQKSASGSQIPSSKTKKHPKNGQAYKWYHTALLRIVSSGCLTATEKLFSVENTKLFNFAIVNLNQDFVYYKSVFAKPKSDSLSRLVIGEDQKNWKLQELSVYTNDCSFYIMNLAHRYRSKEHGRSPQDKIEWQLSPLKYQRHPERTGRPFIKSP